ncbi:hypothetical protein [Bradyrhizobium sp. JYMT SZCCT0428]|uniref:hypothetical protein n=1 Tax=Bradyrhizobium sp. JYMT SZCCT0428 TaxID=2807673 RepID=UPI001BACA852|nr:hypothetical protein [Bradyrhizobium sp. JYMT SZCCT0428]MBR1151553.1 hypothetical protein [Bradyrhizobium sp. JYMT SZCCT0428]
MTRKEPNRGRQAATKLAAARDTAKLESFRSTLRRARFNKSMGTFADKEFATKDSRVKAAYAEAKMRSTNAWKSEFQQDLARAATYLPTTKPATRDDKSALADFLKPLNKLLKGRLRRGDPLPRSAERAAAHLVRERLKFLREKSGKERITRKSGMPAKLIAEAIKDVSLQLKAPLAKISAASVSRLVYKK